MPEGSVAHIVQKRRHSAKRLGVVAARQLTVADVMQAFVENINHTAGHMHGADNVLEPSMFGRGVNPPSGLQLVNLPQSLEPRVIKQHPFRGFAIGHNRDERHIAVNRIMNEAFASIA